MLFSAGSRELPSTMIAFKVFLAFTIIVASYCTKPITKKFMKVSVKSALCNISEEYIYKNVSCFVKSYNRSFSTINLYGLAKRPVQKVFVSELSMR